MNWNAPDVTSNGYYYASFESVTMSCFNATSGVGTNSGTSYTYTGYAGTNDTVSDGDSPTVLSSFQGNGQNLKLGAPSGTASASSTKATATAETVPGVSGGNPAGIDAHDSPTSSGASTSAAPTSGSSSSGSDSGSGSQSGSSGNGFDQGMGTGSGSSTTKSGAENLHGQEKVLKSSVFAGIVAIIAMMAL